MATRLIFEDHENNKLDCFLNQNNLLILAIQKDSDPLDGNLIVLDKEDVGKLIDLLTEYRKEMND